MSRNGIVAFFAFDLNAVSGRDLAGIIKNGIGFKPGHIRMLPQIVRNGPCNIEKRLPKIRGCTKISHLYLRASNRESTPSFHFTTWRSCHMLWLHYHYAEVPPLEFFHRLARLPGFNAGFLVDEEDDYWQNAENLNDYRKYGKPYFHLFVYDDGRVDISGNPGRRFEYPGMLLSSGYRMWFGNEGLRLLGKERLLAFTGAQYIEEQDNGTVFIQLYENPRDYESLENRRSQQDFRVWVGLDKLELTVRDSLNRITEPLE